MQSIHSVAAIVSALALIACGQATAPTQQQADAGAPAAQLQQIADKPSADAAPTHGTVSPHMLIGRWGDNGDCSKDIVFAPNGTFLSYTGGTGQWALDNDVMTMSGPNGTYQVRVSIIDGNTLRVLNPDGSIGTSQRCP